MVKNIKNQNEQLPGFIPLDVLKSEYRVEPGEPDQAYGRASEIVRSTYGYPEEGRTDLVYQELRRARATIAYTELSVGQERTKELYPDIISFFNERIDQILQSQSSIQESRP
jgi:hypothetical protein